MACFAGSLNSSSNELVRAGKIRGHVISRRPNLRFTLFVLAALLSLGISRSAAQQLPFAPATGATASSSIIGGIQNSKPPCRILYLGFVGALEPAGHRNNGVVQIRDILRKPGNSDVCAESFIPIEWTAGRNWILKHFASHPGPLTPDELASSPSVILVGHSTGGWALLLVARSLRSKHIPVELTIQIDSVGFTDFTVPRNVKAGAIFHARDALAFMTTKNLRLEDPAHTKLVANVRVKHANHISVTRDPRIKDLVLATVENLRATSLNAGESHPEVDQLRENQALNDLPPTPAFLFSASILQP
jgi:hypothetical protein